MRKKKYLFVTGMLLAILLASGIFTRIYTDLEAGGRDGGTVRVVTSFYPVYIAALNVVGDSRTVRLENLSEPQTGCMHDYQMTPQDMVKLSDADLFLVNGGGIEGFLAEVGEAYPGLSVQAVTDGVVLLESFEGAPEEGHIHEGESKEGHFHGAENAHAWMDTRRYAQMALNIAKYIGQADPENAEMYLEHAKEYCSKIDGLSEQISALREEVADAGNLGKGTVIFHSAFAYLVEQLGLQTAYCMDFDEERQISAKEVADVVQNIEEGRIRFLFAEELYGKEMGDAVEAETGCSVSYLDPLARGAYDADSYLDAMQGNIDVIRQAVSQWPVGGQ